ncbi:MAG: DUF4340 domain-containing protein [Pirellulaceae bacterium]|nr:DUF4340 domain-containing protein [Pirellulaceae bacterium]
MNETSKTLTFVAVAALVVLTAVFTRPVVREATREDFRGQQLYPDFTDPLAVTSLEIVDFDEETATVDKFLVAETEVNGKTRWVIPSHFNYPADAKDQVADAAGSLLGLTITEMVGDDKGDQKVYGVVEPDPLTLRVGDTGVGLQVVMRDETGKELMSLVIGNEVPDKPGLRYIRKAGEDPIYVVKLNTAKLSTNFADWIERNPLEIQTWDMRQLWFRNYYVDELNRELVQQGNVRIGYEDGGDPQWKLIENQKFADGEWIPIELADDEELNLAALNALKSELDMLKIADVSPKPEGISANLKLEADFNPDRETFEQLRSKGYYLSQIEKDGPLELFSNQGELRVTMKNGVEYVLRFGEIAVGSKKEKREEGAADDGVNRYLFVMAEFNPDVIPKPQFETLPEVKQAEPAEEKQPAQEKQPVEEQPRDEQPAAEKSNAEEQSNAEEKSDAEGKPEAEKKPEAEDKPAEPTAEQIQAERERIEKENQRKQDEYDRQVADGKKRVSELNARFADWYYVISNEVFQKLHLSRDELIKKKEPPAEEAKDSESVPSDAHGETAFPAEVLDKLKARKPAETQQPAEEKPTEGQTSEEKPTDEKPPEAQPAEKPPAKDQPLEDKPVEGR